MALGGRWFFRRRGEWARLAGPSGGNRRGLIPCCNESRMANVVTITLNRPEMRKSDSGGGDGGRDRGGAGADQPRSARCGARF
jgi:hypothetical protein